MKFALSIQFLLPSSLSKRSTKADATFSFVDSKSEEEKLSILPSEALPLILEENFFTDVLKLEFFEVDDFLLQLDLDQEIKQLIIKKNQFLLIDYLLNKSDIYKELRVE